MGGGGKVTCSVAEGAFAQRLLSRFGKDGWRWKKASGATECRAEVGMDLANLSDLLERGADKISEALPRVFTKRT